jgi:hypothetical protein
MGGTTKKTRDHQNLLPTLSVAQEAEELWTNGDDRVIQREKLV